MSSTRLGRRSGLLWNSFSPRRLGGQSLWADAERSDHTQSVAAITGSGTITQSGTTVTGTGTAFLSQVVVGDTLTADAGSPLISGTVNAIASDTSLTLSTSATQASGQTYTTTPVLDTSGRVSQVNDLSGGGNNLTRTGATTRPARVSVLGSGWLWRFDGQNDFFDVPAIDLTGTDKLTLVAVWKGNGAAQAGVVFENSINYNTQGNRPAFAHFRDTTQIQATMAGATGYSDQLSAADPTTLTVVIMTVDLALTATETKGYRNGVAFETQDLDANNTETAFKNQASYVGARAGTSAFLSGDIAAIHLLQQAVDANLRRKIEAYYHKRRGIAV